MPIMPNTDMNNNTNVLFYISSYSLVDCTA